MNTRIIITLQIACLLLNGCGRVDAGIGESEAAPQAAKSITAAVDQPEDATESGTSLLSLDDLVPEMFTVLTSRWSGDLDGMAERRIVRTLVVAGGPQFFYYHGKPRGVVAELLLLLQEDLNKELGRGLDAIEIVPMPVSRDRLIPALLSGHADLIAADLTVTDARAELVDFSTPLLRNVNELVVFAPKEGQDVAVLDDLAGRTLFVRRSSSYFEHLSALNDEFSARGLPPIHIDEADELLRSQDILEMVNAGLVPGTVIDGYKANNWTKIFTDMQVRKDLVVHEGGSVAWAFRKDSPQLAEAVNRFAREHRQGTLIGNVLIKRYMENLDWVRNSTSEEGIERLKPLFAKFRASAAETGLDPLMLVAQAYQESKLNPSKTSPAGAVGIMQIKPSTARDKNVGIDDISETDSNIRAGARYMRFLDDRYFSDAEMTEDQRWFFTLAAYNAGPARVQRLRKQAAAEGHDPNQWFGNVELIAARKIGRETVHYVRNVFKYFVAYRMAWEDQTLREAMLTD